ncbi:MAG: DUF6097 family protein [Corticimicrobacter sp.]|uniref:DUF6097 family protein n=1 Tax=Corticimicrobacter sp. TaxID=2678536 RepID=UPI0032D9B037
MSLFGFASALGSAMENTELLKALHQRIEQQRVPVASRDDLGPQLLELERYMGSTAFSDVQSRVRKSTIWMIVVFLPVAVFMLLAGGAYGLEMFGVGSGVDAVVHQLALFVTAYPSQVMVWAALAIAILVYWKWLGHKAGQVRLALADAFFEKTEPAAPFGGA